MGKVATLLSNPPATSTCKFSQTTPTFWKYAISTWPSDWGSDFTLCLIPAFWFASFEDVKYSRRSKRSSSSRPFSGSRAVVVESVVFLMLLADLFDSWRERVLNSSSALRTSICDEFNSLIDADSSQLGLSEWPLSAISPQAVNCEGVLTNLHRESSYICWINV